MLRPPPPRERPLPRKPVKRLGRPPATDGERTRQRILLAAQESFGESGFDGATYGDIAESVGLTARSIHHHFGLKADLYAEVCDHARGLTIARLEAAAARHETFVDKFAAMLGAAIELHTGEPSLARFLVTAPVDARRHPDLAPVVDRLLDDLATFFRDIVAEAVKRGEVRPGHSVESVAGLMQAFMFGMCQFTTIAPPELGTAAIMECQRLIEGVLLRPAGRPAPVEARRQPSAVRGSAVHGS